MPVNEMNLEEVNKRLEQLDIEVREANEVEAVNKAIEEKKELLARKKELEELEARKKDAEALQTGAAQPEKTFTEQRKENNMPEKRYMPDSAEYREAWLKMMQGKEIDAEARAAITATDAIPTETANMVINRLRENDLLQYVDIWNVPGNLKIPAYTTNNDPDWTTTASDKSDVIGSVSLTPFQLIKTLEVSGAVDKMSIDAFEAAIVSALVNKLESALQKAVIVGAGSGSSQPTGIAVTHVTADGTFTKAAITKADVLKIMGKLPAVHQKDAVWIMPNALFYEVMANADLYGFAGVSEGMKKQIGGKPVVVDDNCVISSTDTIFYGNAKAYHINFGEAPKVDKDLSVGFRSNSAVYRGVLQADGKLDDEFAFVKYTRAT